MRPGDDYPTPDEFLSVIRKLGARGIIEAAFDLTVVVAMVIATIVTPKPIYKLMAAAAAGLIAIGWWLGPHRRLWRRK